MADFHQSGAITTLHNLRTRSPDSLADELDTIATTQKITLILPSLYSELKGEALQRIIEELNRAGYIHRIVIGLDRASRQEYQHARTFFAQLDAPHALLWNDGPRLRAIDQRLAQAGLSPREPGKGRNVWFCIGYTLARGDSDVIAIHDCDIVTYSRDMLARLVYPVAHPRFPYQFCKGYYARIGDGTMNGRVSRLLLAPLLLALRKTTGQHDYIDYLRSFRYPLAGEFAMRTATLPEMRMPSDWGLEIGTLSEVWRNMSRQAICQVELADNYDHKHQPLSADDASRGLSRMSMDISKAIFRKLATHGTVFSNATFRALKASYYRIALDYVESYYNDARMNGLHVDRHKEEEAIELFAANLVKAGRTFIDNPMETPFIPSWSRVQAADPTLMADLLDAVRADEQEFAVAGADGPPGNR